jgi:hypothetical protein
MTAIVEFHRGAAGSAGNAAELREYAEAVAEQLPDGLILNCWRDEASGSYTFVVSISAAYRVADGELRGGTVGLHGASLGRRLCAELQDFVRSQSE